MQRRSKNLHLNKTSKELFLLKLIQLITFRVWKFPFPDDFLFNFFFTRYSKSSIFWATSLTNHYSLFQADIERKSFYLFFLFYRVSIILYLEFLKVQIFYDCLNVNPTVKWLIFPIISLLNAKTFDSKFFAGKFRQEEIFCPFCAFLSKAFILTRIRYNLDLINAHFDQILGRDSNNGRIRTRKYWTKHFFEFHLNLCV